MLLGLDLGTTNVKALIADRAGRPVAQASSPIQWLNVGAGGIEQDIEEIEQATLTVLRQAVQGIDPADVEAIGVSSQGGALQVLDARSRPVGRVISWLDSRGAPFDEALTRELGRSWFLDRLHRGRSALTAGQVLRLREQHPDRLTSGARLGFVGDIVVARLCGHAAHDPTSCALTSLYNPRRRGYDLDLLNRLNLHESQLPDLISPRQPAGGLRLDIARATGLPAGVPVSPAIHDQYAAALGSGVVQPGTVMVGAGTAWVLLAVSDELLPPATDEAFVGSHVIDGLFGQLVSLVNGGSALDWALRLTGLAGKEANVVEALLHAARPGTDGLACWPFLAPAGIARVAPGTTGRLLGVQLGHGPGDLLRAVVEGLAMELNRHLGFLRGAGLPVERLVLSGGAASSAVTRQIIADVTELPLDCVGRDAASALGAVILARGLLEPEASLATLSEGMRAPSERVAPGTDAPLYRQLYARYLAGVPAIESPQP
jgi:xylulokinase